MAINFEITVSVAMAVLATQGHKKLGLTNASDNKQLVFVKLTDSFYEALSNYIQNQTKLQSKVRFEKVWNQLAG